MKFSSTQPIHIFLVEDDAEDQQLFADALMEISENIRLSILNNGEELLTKLRKATHLPDMIFLDLYMPVMNGETCLKKIREEKQWDSLPVLLFSTTFDLGLIERLFDLGANRYLQKPVSFKDLVYSLEKTIESLTRNGLGSPTAIHISS